jgi:hypothetical protein
MIVEKCDPEGCGKWGLGSRDWQCQGPWKSREMGLSVDQCPNMRNQNNDDEFSAAFEVIKTSINLLALITDGSIRRAARMRQSQSYDILLPLVTPEVMCDATTYDAKMNERSRSAK